MQELGCAQNADGTLKDASQIEWSYSRSPSPTLFPTQDNLNYEAQVSKAPVPAQTSQPRASPLTHEAPTNKGTQPPGKRLKQNPRRPLTIGKVKEIKRRFLTYYDKLEVLRYADGQGKGLTYGRIASNFHYKWPWLKQYHISRIIKEREKLQAIPDNQLAYKRPGNFEFPQLEAALALWFNNSQHRIVMTAPIIRAKAVLLADKLEIPKEKQTFSSGWVDAFKLRHGIRQIFRHGDAASTNITAVEAARQQIIEIISKYKLRDIYNFDETGLFWRMMPNRTLASYKQAGMKDDKSRITIGVMTNADGSDIRKPLIIGHARRPRCFEKREGRDLGYYYFWNKSAWMENSIWNWYAIC